MKITKETFKNIVREVMTEESEYQDFFKRALEKTGKSIPEMSDEEKKAFFNKIDAAWDAKGEKNEELTGNQHKLDVDGDGEIEASDLAALRAGKTNEAKYPTSLYVNSIIYGQGFTGLKGIEDGKYYKVVEMDDTTATLAPCDQKGKITGSKKVRHKLSSLEDSIKTAKRGDENGIVIESVNEAMASGAWVGLEKTPKGPKLVKTFKSGNEAKAWVMKSPGGHSIMTKKDWDVSEGKSEAESVNESLTANDGKILLNGKPVGYYDYDRGSAAFWTTDLSDKQFRGSKAFDTKEEMLAFFKKYLSRAAKALEYKRKALAKFGIKYPADESVNEGIGTIALGVAGGLLLLKTLGFVVKKVLGTIGMNVKLPKEKLLQVVEDMTKNVMQNAGGGKVDMLHLAKLKSYLMDEIKNGKITNVKQIMQVIDNLSKKDESVNEAINKDITNRNLDLLDKAADMAIKNPKGNVVELAKIIKKYVRDIRNSIKESIVNEATKPTIKVVSKLKPEQGIQIVVTKTTDGDTMYGGFVVRGKLQRVIPVGANNSKEGVQKRALQIWDEFGKQLGETINEDKIDWADFYKMAKDRSGHNPNFEKKYGKVLSRPHVADAVKTAKDFKSFMKFIQKFENINEVSSPKEIAVLQKERDTLAAKGSAIMDKQRQLIRTTLGNKFEFPWENYDKWPNELKMKVAKLDMEFEKNNVEVQKAFEKLMKAKGTWR